MFAYTAVECLICLGNRFTKHGSATGREQGTPRPERVGVVPPPVPLRFRSAFYCSREGLERVLSNQILEHRPQPTREREREREKAVWHDLLLCPALDLRGTRKRLYVAPAQ